MIVLVDLGLGLALDHVNVMSLLSSEVRNTWRSVLHEAALVFSQASETYSLHCELLLLLLAWNGSQVLFLLFRGELSDFTLSLLHK